MDQQLALRERERPLFGPQQLQQRGMAGGNGAMSERWVVPDDGEEGEMGQ